MTAQDIVDYCQKKEGAFLCFPFREVPVCFKIGKMIFCELYPDDNDFKVTLRCDKETALILREKYPGDVIRGYYCPPVQQPYKNTVYLNRSVPDNEIYVMIDTSYLNAKNKQKMKG